MTTKPRIHIVDFVKHDERKVLGVYDLFKPLWINFLNDPDLFPNDALNLDDSVDRMDQALTLFNARRTADDNWCLEFDTEEDMMTFIIKFS